MQTPQGFVGLQDHLPIRTYEQVLPHWRQAGATYFVTFRLADSLPQSKTQYLERLKKEWKQHNPKPRSAQAEEFTKKLIRLMENWLDQGYGSCLLKNTQNIELLSSELHAGHLQHYELGCYVIMPNHVHAVVKPLHLGYELEDILKGWKGASALKIHRSEKVAGTLWQRESYDRIIRDLEHLLKVVQYIGKNPEKAGIAASQKILWLNPAWREVGWKFIHE